MIVVCGGSMTANGFGLGEEADLTAQKMKVAQIFNTPQQLHSSTSTAFLPNPCYGLPFHDNALGGFVKPTSIIMAKSQNGGSQPPKKKNTMYNFGSVHTGSNSTNPGVLKAQADKAKRDSVAAEYKKKADAVKKAQGKK